MPEVLRPKDAEGKLFLYIETVGPWQWLTFKFEHAGDEKNLGLGLLLGGHAACIFRIVGW